MVDEQDTFGVGVFDTHVSNEAPPDDAPIEKIVLTEREEAIAGGNDPDDPDAGHQIERDNEARTAGTSTHERAATEEDDADDDDTGSESDDDQGDDDAAVEWSASDLRLAKMSGLTDADLKELPNVEALHSTIDVLARHQPKQAKDEADNENDDGDAGKPAADPDAAGSGKASGEALKAIENLTPIDLKDFEGYEGTDLALIKSVKETQEALKQVHVALSQQTTAATAYEEQQAVAAQKQVVDHFNATLDKYPQIYGELKDGKVTKVFQDARDAVRDQAQVIFQGHVAQGTENSTDIDTIFAQAMRSVHGNQTRKNSPTTAQTQEQRRANLKRQSDMRRSPGRKAASSKRVQTQSDDPEVIADDPELVEFFKAAQIENGVV